MTKPSIAFEVHNLAFLQDPEEAALYLEESYQEGGDELFQLALMDLVKA